MFRINGSNQFLVRNNNNNKWEFQTKDNKITCKHSFVDVKSLINNWFENPDNNEYSKICPKCDEISLIQNRYNQFLDNKKLQGKTIGFRFDANKQKELEDADDLLFEGANKISIYHLTTFSFYIFYLLKYLDQGFIIQRDIDSITTPDFQNKIYLLRENSQSTHFYDGQDLFLFDQIPTYELKKTFPEDRLFGRVGTPTNIKELDMEERENMITTGIQNPLQPNDVKQFDQKLDVTEKQLFGIKRNLFDHNMITSRKILEDAIARFNNNKQQQQDINKHCVEIDKTDGSLIFSCYDKIHNKINYIFKIDVDSNIIVNHSRKDFERKHNLNEEEEAVVSAYSSRDNSRLLVDKFYNNVDYTNNDNTESIINEVVVSSILSSRYTDSIRGRTHFCPHFPITFGFYIKNINNDINNLYDTDSFSILHEYLLPHNILEKFNLLQIKTKDVGIEEHERYRFKFIEKLLFEITYAVAFMQISVNERVMHNNLKVSNIKLKQRRKIYLMGGEEYASPKDEDDDQFFLEYIYNNSVEESTNPARYYLQNVEYKCIMTNFTKATLNPTVETQRGLFTDFESFVQKSLLNDYGDDNSGVSKFEPGYDILTFYLDLLFQLRKGPSFSKGGSLPRISFIANHTKTQDLFLNLFSNMVKSVTKNIEDNGTETEKGDFKKIGGFKAYLDNIFSRNTAEEEYSYVDVTSTIDGLWESLMKNGNIATIETRMVDGQKIEYVNVKHNTFVTRWWKPQNVLSRDSNVFEGLRQPVNNSKLIIKGYSEIKKEKSWYIKD